MTKLSTLMICAALAVAAPAAAEVKAGQRAADFEKTSLDGQSVRLSALRGKVVLVDFWASWCEPCKKELPLLSKMAARLHARGIEIVTINIDDSRDKADAFIRTHTLDHLIVVADSDKSIVAKYEPPKMPTSFLIDRAGIVRSVNAGYEEGDDAKIEQALVSLAGH